MLNHFEACQWLIVPFDDPPSPRIPRSTLTTPPVPVFDYRQSHAGHEPEIFYLHRHGDQQRAPSGKHTFTLCLQRAMHFQQAEIQRMKQVIHRYEGTHDRVVSTRELRLGSLPYIEYTEADIPLSLADHSFI